MAPISGEKAVEEVKEEVHEMEEKVHEAAEAEPAVAEASKEETEGNYSSFFCARGVLLLSVEFSVPAVRVDFGHIRVYAIYCMCVFTPHQDQTPFEKQRRSSPTGSKIE